LHFLNKSECGKYTNLIISLSLYSKLASFFFGFLNKLARYLRVLVRLFELESQIEFHITDEILEKFGFETITKSL
jgi:hypothetical protein